MSPVAILAFALVLARAIAELWLSRVNQRYVRANADEVPTPLRGVIDEATYRRSVDYTLAKNRFGDVVTLFDAVLLIAVLLSGILPWAFGKFAAAFGTSVLAMAGFLFATGVALSIVSLPFAWYAQFKLEERFGFNTTSVKTWLLDRVKGFLLPLLLGYPLLALVLKLIEWTGANWWLWTSAVVIAFQLRSIEVMDGSKRSRHSNAFFTGFGRFRKIVLFDTLIEQLSEPELESVLAHEIGHYKKRHVVKLLGFSIAGVFAAFAAIAWLARQEWFYRAFGFEPQEGFGVVNVVLAMLLFGLLAGTISFWLSPFFHAWSRRFEYQADAFARATMGEAQSLIQALRKLNEKNLSNLMPHPLYSGFYYSHPTLLERERALRMAP